MFDAKELLEIYDNAPGEKCEDALLAVAAHVLRKAAERIDIDGGCKWCEADLKTWAEELERAK